MTKQTKPAEQPEATDPTREFVIWGIPPGQAHEEPLYTKARSEAEAEIVIGQLVGLYGVTKTRVQILDLLACPSELFKSPEIINIK